MQPYKICPQCNGHAPLDAYQCRICAHQFRSQMNSLSEETQGSALPPQYAPPPSYAPPPAPNPPGYSQLPSAPPQTGYPPQSGYQNNYPPQTGYPPQPGYYQQPGYPMQPGYAPYATRKDKIVAGLLAFFLGGFGVHGFYLGNNRMGLTLLALNIFGILTSWLLIGLLFVIPISIICLVQAILYWVANENDFHQKYVVEQRWF